MVHHSDCINKPLTDAQRAQIRALTEAGFKLWQLCHWYRRSEGAIERAQDNDLAIPAVLSKDLELLDLDDPDHEFLSYLADRDTVGLKAYIRRSVQAQLDKPTVRSMRSEKRKRKFFIEAEVGEVTGKGEDEDNHDEGNAVSKAWTTKKPRLEAALRAVSRKHPVRSATKHPQPDYIKISDDEDEPVVTKVVAKKEHAESSSASPSKTTMTSPSRNPITVPSSSLNATLVEHATRPSSSHTQSNDTSSNRQQSLHPTGSTSSSTAVTVSASLVSFLSKVNPSLIRFDVAVTQFGLKTIDHLRALRDMPVPRRERNLEKMQKKTGMSPFEAETFDYALDTALD